MTAASRLCGAAPHPVVNPGIPGRIRIWVFGIVDPATGWSMVSPHREVNSVTMQQFLKAAITSFVGLKYVQSDGRDDEEA